LLSEYVSTHVLSNPHMDADFMVENWCDFEQGCLVQKAGEPSDREPPFDVARRAPISEELSRCVVVQEANFNVSADTHRKTEFCESFGDKAFTDLEHMWLCSC